MALMFIKLYKPSYSLSVPIIRKRFIYFAQIDNEIGHRPIPEQAGLDGSKGVPVKQLHRISPLLPEEPSGFFSHSVTLLSNAYCLKCQDEIVSGYIITSKSGQKLRAYYSLSFTPNQRNKFIKTCHCSTNQPSRPF